MTMGSVTKPEQQSTIHKKRQSNRIEIRNVPDHVTQQDLEVLVKNWGTVKKVHQVTNDSEPYYTVIFDTPEEAQSACEHLNEYEFEGCNLKVEITNNNPASGKLVNNFRGPRNMGHNPASNLVGGNNRPVRNGGGCPLRILVPSDFVGAIIGRKGQTIKNITQKCKARVDVHGKENNGVMDKISDKVVISIYGQPENCTNACKEILQVLQQESTNNNRGDVLLKMLANDRFCGRIIGKEGKMIKKIKEETGTKIAVSNAQEMAALFPDRVIAIKGTLEGMSQAESAISAKLAECIEQDQAQSFHGGMMVPHGPMGPNYFYPNNRVFDGPGFYNHPPHPLLHPHLHGGGFHPHPGPNFNHPAAGPGVIQNESLHISVPNTAVGALIGTGGATIKQMMRGSMAFINIESKKEGDTSLERVVIIKGFPDSCWRAAFMVFEKMKMEGFAGFDEVRLKTCIEVPKVLVGRVIGKAGKNVRELQRLTGALIKLPEDPNSQGEQVAVDVFGNFYATRNAVSRIRNMMIQSQMKGAFNNHQQLPNSQSNLQRQGSQEPHQSELQQPQQQQTGNSSNGEPQTEAEGDVVPKC